MDNKEDKEGEEDQILVDNHDNNETKSSRQNGNGFSLIMDQNFNLKRPLSYTPG